MCCTKSNQTKIQWGARDLELIAMSIFDILAGVKSCTFISSYKHKFSVQQPYFQGFFLSLGTGLHVQKICKAVLKYISILDNSLKVL